MEFYKVYFESNHPVSAYPLLVMEEKRVDITNRDGKRNINSLTVFGHNAIDCIDVARHVALGLAPFLK